LGLLRAKREAWDSGNLRVMTKSSPAVATGAHVGIVADITTDELRRELHDTEAVNGFANRFLWLLVRRSKLLAEPPEFGGPAVEALVGELRDALVWARGAARVERDGGAAELWRAMYPDLSADREGLAGSILARAEAHVLRLSLVYALLDRSPVVTAAHLLAAAELWAYAERSARYVFGDATGDPVADTIYQALLASRELSRGALIDLFGRHKPAARIAQALQALLTAGKATCERRDTDGRAAEVWRAVR